MQITLFVEYYHKRNLPKESLNLAIHYLNQLDEFCRNVGLESVDQLTTDLLDQFIQKMRKETVDKLELLLSIGRYYRLIKRNDLYIHITKYLGKLGVIESIVSRSEQLTNATLLETIKEELCQIDLLTTPEEAPVQLQTIMDTLEKYIEPNTLDKILAFNHHQIPKSAFDEEVKYYQKANSLDDYLLDLHKRSIDEITRCFEKNEVWYEQQITQRVIDYVSSNQEILSAVRAGNDLYVTKIPYDTEQYLAATTDKEKAYHACHCPFAKEAIRKDHAKISPKWCYCSGGFTKYPFEVIFGKELEVTPLELAIHNSTRCRFKISLEGVDYK
ncbi:MAG TPA: hypothetical protein PLR26_04745 [Bacilli bacterium]|nr:hypothetical protein [Bacilli bacterium]